MSTLERAITQLRMGSRWRSAPIDARAQLIATLLFAAAVLSTPMLDPGRLVWMFCFPIVMAEAFGLGYGRIFVKSLWLLPFIAVVGIFNPIYDHEPCLAIGGWVVSRGWVSFVSIILRGLLTVQALLVLVGSCGFPDMCRAMGKLGLPHALVCQLLMLYRYITVLLCEALAMDRARKSRGYGKSSYKLSLWATFAGQLMLRSMRRAKRVGMAIDARGGDRALDLGHDLGRLRWVDYVYLFGWIAAFAALRFIDFTSLFSRLISQQ